MYLCDRGVDIVSFHTIFLLEFGNVLIVWYFVFSVLHVYYYSLSVVHDFYDIGSPT